jgi:hypothetical protein
VASVLTESVGPRRGKEKLCFADWHRRYYARRARKYHRIDYWMRCFIGVFALAGVVMAGVAELRMIGAFLAGGCAFIMANLLPIFKWDVIVAGFKEEEEAWTRIFKGYEEVVSFTEISDRKSGLACRRHAMGSVAGQKRNTHIGTLPGISRRRKWMPSWRSCNRVKCNVPDFFIARIFKRIANGSPSLWGEDPIGTVQRCVILTP